MNLTRTQLRKQFDRAFEFGWLPHFVEAVDAHTKGFFDEADLMAIASRETNLDAKWLTKPGDRGNGFGLMQADRRSFPEFTKGENWKDARSGILFGAKVLMAKWTDLQNCIGKIVTVRSSKGGAYSFFGKEVEGADAQCVAIAGYNAGRWGHYAVSTNRPVDKYTTGGDYSGDVVERATVLRPWIEKWKADNMSKKDDISSAVNPPATANPGSGESPALADDNFLADAIDKNVTPDQVKTAATSTGRKLWKFLFRPLGFLYAALEAGNVYAWAGVVVGVALAGWLVYLHRQDLKKLWLKLAAKLNG